DNELHSTRCSEVELHLKDCKECSQMVNDLGNLSNLLRSCDVPVPNLPTGQQILVKTGLKPVTANVFSQFFHSVYSFLFKYKSPVLVTISAIAVVAVVININGVKNGNLSIYSESPTVSPAIAIAEKNLSDDLKNASTIRQSTPQEQELAKTNSIISEKVASIAPNQAQPKTLAAPEPSSLEAKAESTVEGNVDGGITSGVAGGLGVSRSEFTTSESVSLPQPPSAIVPEAKPTKIDIYNNTQSKDELGKSDSIGRAIILNKAPIAKKEATKPVDTPVETSTIPLSEEPLVDKVRDNKIQNLPSNEVAKAKPAEANGEKKEKVADKNLGFGKEIATKSPKGSAKISRSGPSQDNSNLGLSGQLGTSMSNSTAVGAMAAKPVISSPAREEARKLVVKSTQMAIETTDLNPTKERLNQLVKEQQGTIVTSQTEQIVKVTIRIPVAKFESTLAQLRKLGKVTQEKTNEKDVSLGDLEKQTEDSKRVDSKGEKNKKSDEQDQVEIRRRQKQSEASMAIINLILQVKEPK
ncbi:MAG: hypothetical protein FD167_1559, partial [bacterium]